MPDYIATLRAVFKADDDVEAAVIAEVCRENAGSDLDSEEDKDEVVLTQVERFGTDTTPEELIVQFTRTRNSLIRTRYVQCWDIARELDKVIHILRGKLIGHEAMLANYDYGHFMEVAQEILTNHGDPHD